MKISALHVPAFHTNPQKTPTFVTWADLYSSKPETTSWSQPVLAKTHLLIPTWQLLTAGGACDVTASVNASRSLARAGPALRTTGSHSSCHLQQFLQRELVLQALAHKSRCPSRSRDAICPSTAQKAAGSPRGPRRKRQTDRHTHGAGRHWPSWLNHGPHKH